MGVSWGVTRRRRPRFLHPGACDLGELLFNCWTSLDSGIVPPAVGAVAWMEGRSAVGVLRSGHRAPARTDSGSGRQVGGM